MRSASLTAIALQNKWLLVAYWFVVGISVLAVGPRELLRRPLLWLGAVLAVLVTLPNLLWQAHHGWPQLAMTQVIAKEVTAKGSIWGGRVAFLPLVLMTAGVGVGTALFCYGLWRLLRSPELRSYRFLGWTFVGMVVLFLVTGGRFYYLAGLMAPLLAAGAVESQRREPARWWRWVLTWPIYALSAIIALTALPVLPASWPTSARLVALTSLGWPELADQVAGAYLALPPATQRTSAVIAEWYWDASALDRYGPARGLPHPFSPHRGYWYFGAPPDAVDTVLFIGSDRHLPAPVFHRGSASSHSDQPCHEDLLGGGQPGVALLRQAGAVVTALAPAASFVKSPCIAVSSSLPWPPC